MKKIEIDIPDDLAMRIKVHDNPIPLYGAGPGGQPLQKPAPAPLNVSDIVRRALHAELTRRERLASLGDTGEEVELDVTRGEVDGRPIENHTVTFVGRQLRRLTDFQLRNMEMSAGAVYITPQERLAVVGKNANGTHFYVYDDLEALADAVNGEVVADLAVFLSETRPIRLDI